jgi:endoglycosylceramidase
VTGGDILSAPNAADLVIASNAGPSAVTVTVSPAGT